MWWFLLGALAIFLLIRYCYAISQLPALEKRMEDLEKKTESLDKKIRN